jgi:hypothetical protein
VAHNLPETRGHLLLIACCRGNDARKHENMSYIFCSSWLPWVAVSSRMVRNKWLGRWVVASQWQRTSSLREIWLIICTSPLG